MSANERIDPGPGWRLLTPGEVKPQGYEYKSPSFGWIKGEGVGNHVLIDGFPCRVRSPQRTTKAIATRATVRGELHSGAIAVHSVERKAGLTPEQMAFASEQWGIANKYLSESGAKYIMLEIQREGEP